MHSGVLLALSISRLGRCQRDEDAGSLTSQLPSNFVGFVFPSGLKRELKQRCQVSSLGRTRHQEITERLQEITSDDAEARLKKKNHLPSLPSRKNACMT